MIGEIMILLSIMVHILLLLVIIFMLVILDDILFKNFYITKLRKHMGIEK